MGWTAQYFTTIIIEGTSPQTGIFLYNGAPGLGTLVGSWTVAAGVDQYGNAYAQGFQLQAVAANATNIFSILDTNGNILAAIDNEGDLQAVGTISAGVDVLINGISVSASLADAPQGILNRGWAPASTGGLPWPSVAIGNVELALLQLNFTVLAGRFVMVAVYPTDFIPTIAANAQAIQRLRFTSSTSGPPTTPTTTSTEAIGHSPVIASIPAGLTGFNYEMPYMEYLLPVPLVDTQYSFLLTGRISAGSYQYSNLTEMRAEDLGLGVGQQVNSGVILGTGGSGGGGGKQTYTDTFYPANTYSYYSNFGLRNTNGSMYQGAYSGEGPAYQYSYIGWNGSGQKYPGNGSLANILANFTVNSASLRLTCAHSWYNSGMTVGLHTSTVLGSTGYSTIINPGGSPIAAGQTKQFALGAGQISDIFAANTYTVLAPDAGDLTNLQWYGYFQGGAGAANLKPMLTVNYTG